MSALQNYILRLGDMNLILGQRLSEWTGHGPFLEEDLALTNISLDLFGTARSLMQYASELDQGKRSEDDLAFLRGEREFLNPLLCEMPNGDYACTIARQFLVDAFQLPLYTQLSKCKNETLAGIASKALKETQYHLRHSSSWMERFGNGTEESHSRLTQAVQQLWPYTDDLFAATDNYEDLIKTINAPLTDDLRKQWNAIVQEVFSKSSLSIPENMFMHKGSVKGMHTEHLGYLLTEMQYLQRAFPGAKW